MNRRLEVEKAAYTLIDAYLDAGETKASLASIGPFVVSLAKALALPLVDAPLTDDGNGPLKHTNTLRAVMERVLARLPEAPPQPTGPSLPLPATDAVPPPSHHDTDQEPTP